MHDMHLMWRVGRIGGVGWFRVDNGVFRMSDDSVNTRRPPLLSLMPDNWQCICNDSHRALNLLGFNVAAKP